MREPLENPELTGGVCAGHKQRLLESVPSRSFPGVELLIVVRRNGTLFERLERSFYGVPGAKVILERRVADRRGAPSCDAAGERRHLRNRRIRCGTPSPLGEFTVVRFAPKTTVPPLARN